MDFGQGLRFIQLIIIASAYILLVAKNILSRGVVRLVVEGRWPVGFSGNKTISAKQSYSLTWVLSRLSLAIKIEL